MQTAEGFFFASQNSNKLNTTKINSKSIDTVKFQLDKNFYLIINVNFKASVAILSGSIFHKNGFPLKLSHNLWKVVQQFQSLQNSSYAFQCSSQSNTLSFISKVIIPNPSKKSPFPEIETKSQQMYKDARQFISKSYQYGLLQFSNKISLKQSIQQAALKHSIFKEIYHSKNILNQINKLQKKLSEFSLRQMRKNDQSGENDENLCATDCFIKQIKPTQKMMSPKQLQWGQKSIMNNFIKSKTQPLISGGFFSIQKKLCQFFPSPQSIKNYYQYKKKQQSITETLSGSQDQIKIPNLKIIAKKTLKNERKNDKLHRLKLEKQLAIINQIKNKKYILKYYKNNLNDSSFNYQQKNINMDIQQDSEMSNLKEDDKMTQSTMNSSKNNISTSLSMQQIQQKQEFCQEIYMEFHSHTLNDLLGSRVLSLDESMKLAMQLMESVMNLHESYVIHRDLKPSNILVDFTSNRTEMLLKVIDFAESAIYTQQNQRFEKNMNQQIRKQIFESFNIKLYGATQPYSPPECIIEKSSRNSKGINNFKIDSWSMGMLLYEICHQKKAIDYSEPYAQDIDKPHINKRFQISGIRRYKRGVKMFESFLTNLTLSNLIWDQQKRLGIDLMYRLNTKVEKVINKWLSNIHLGK